MKDLREYIRGLMEEQNLSKAELSEKLGYRSRTSIDRIINASTRAEGVRKFEQALLRTFPFTEQQKTELHQVIQISIYGEEKYLTALKMWDFVQGTSRVQADKLCITDAKSRKTVNLLKRHARAKKIQATVINCQYVVSLFDILKKLLQHEENSVKQYIYVNSDSVRTVCAVNALMTIFYEKNYSAYVRNREYIEGASWDCGFNEADMMTVSWRDSDETSHMDMILFSGTDSGG